MRSQLLVFWDYDTQWGADRSRSPGGRKGWGGLEFSNTEELLAVHETYEVPACFAVVGAAALNGCRPYHDPGQIRAIRAAGHEIASHSQYHEWLPALDRARLVETLRTSKDTLEQCVGSEVLTFVPPFNQPFDYARRASISISERRQAGSARTNLSGLCTALAATGYRFCRVAYRPIWERVWGVVSRKAWNRPARLEAIAGIQCVRMNMGTGFDAEPRAFLAEHAGQGGLFIATGHPHSLHSGGPQDLEHLRRFLELVADLRSRNILEVSLPAALLA
ncbi:MAG TPA: polysaccharide deacetylase family protein [Bryobacteraceae bacterium]|nr:polysaccharide deacetylase family protein [Bryobacteraceae bacterium]